MGFVEAVGVPSAPTFLVNGALLFEESAVGDLHGRRRGRLAPYGGARPAGPDLGRLRPS